MNEIGHADGIGVGADQPQQVDPRSAVTLRGQQVVECALRERVARKVGRVVGDDRRAQDARAVGEVHRARNRLPRHHDNLEAVVSRQGPFQIKVGRRAKKKYERGHTPIQLVNWDLMAISAKMLKILIFFSFINTFLLGSCIPVNDVYNT